MTEETMPEWMSDLVLDSITALKDERVKKDFQRAGSAILHNKNTTGFLFSEEEGFSIMGKLEEKGENGPVITYGRYRYVPKN